MSILKWLKRRLVVWYSCLAISMLIGYFLGGWVTLFFGWFIWLILAKIIEFVWDSFDDE